MLDGVKSLISDTWFFDSKVYESTIPEGETNKSILRTIKGPVAEYGNLNRNKRKYTEKLWDKVLESDYLAEQLKYKTLLGEANHPTDRYEVDFSRVSHSITEMWKVPASNQIYATIHILNTPLGKILNTIYEAGGILGYSSRAGGVLHQRKDYIDVDVDSYNFITFDAVPFPSVVSARPGEISEGYTPDVVSAIHEGLCGLIKKSSNEERNVISSFIKELDGDFSKETALLESFNIVSPETSDNSATMSLLKEGTVQINKLKAEVQSLRTANEGLTKDNQTLKESLNSSVTNLSKVLEEADCLRRREQNSNTVANDTIKKLKDRISVLESTLEDNKLEFERLESVESACKALTYQNRSLVSESGRVNLLNSKISELTEQLNESKSKVLTLVKEGKEKDSTIGELQKQVRFLKEDVSDLQNVNEGLESEKLELASGSSRANLLSNENAKLKKEIEQLNESVSAIRSKSENYKDEMISVICERYNLTIDSVKPKLKAGFTKSDVYTVCESMAKVESTPVIVSESKPIVDNSKVSTDNKNTSVKDLFSMMGNRRGI